MHMKSQGPICRAPGHQAHDPASRLAALALGDGLGNRCLGLGTLARLALLSLSLLGTLLDLTEGSITRSLADLFYINNVN